MMRYATASAAYDELQLIVAKQLCAPMRTEMRFVQLSWRERWRALNQWRWDEFRSGYGYREYVVADISGLAAVLDGAKSWGQP